MVCLKKIIVDNFFIQNRPDPFLIDTYEKAVEIINTIGNFRNLYIIDIDEKTLINRYKAKEGITEEITEDQKAAFNETIFHEIKIIFYLLFSFIFIIKVFNTASKYHPPHRRNFHQINPSACIDNKIGTSLGVQQYLP